MCEDYDTLYIVSKWATFTFVIWLIGAVIYHFYVW